MLCPRCNAKMKVIDTGDASTPGLNLRVRDWRCTNPRCRFLLPTKEVEDLGRAKRARHFARALLQGKATLPD